MIKVYCDKCGKLIPDEELKDTELKTRPMENPDDIDMVLCGECCIDVYTTVGAWLKDKRPSYYKSHPELKEES